jgi:hypothetical protein
MRVAGAISSMAIAALAFGSADAQLKKQPSPFAGQWRGKYVCAQGVTALTLTIRDRARNELEATFDFGPLPSNPTVPRGAYHLDGTYRPGDDRVTLTPKTWIRQPVGYAMVGLNGRLSPLGLHLAGEVDGPGCTIIELVRDEPLMS